MKFLLILITFIIVSLGSTSAWALTDNDLNVRTINIGSNGQGTNQHLSEFMAPIQSFFFSPGVTGGDGVMNTFIQVAFNIKNFFVLIAVFFLIIGVVKLLFMGGDEERIKKWRSNIIWVSAGIVVMQLAFSVWNTLILRDSAATVGSMLGWHIWLNIFSPIVGLLQMLASLGFLFMMVYAFFTIVGGGGDEEKMKNGKNIVIYALIGFLLIKVPRALISAIYGSPDCKESEFLWTSDCAIKNQDLKASIGIIGNLFNYLDTFLGVLCVILIIYAGWLVLLSGGDEEKLKKAKNIILYILIGLILLVASHAIFRFFILNG